jgi:hypothetical protein
MGGLLNRRGAIAQVSTWLNSCLTGVWYCSPTTRGGHRHGGITGPGCSDRLSGSRTLSQKGAFDTDPIGRSTTNTRCRLHQLDLRICRAPHRLVDLLDWVVEVCLGQPFRVRRLRDGNSNRR